jgi:hypothetical protein
VLGNLIAIYSALSSEPFCSPAEFPWGYRVEVGPLAAGEYTVTHTLDGVVTQRLFVVTPVNPAEAIAPFIYAEADNQPATVSPGEAFSYTVEVDGIPSPTFSLLESPPGMSIEPLSGFLSWTLTMQAAPVVTVTVLAVNSAGSDEHTFYLQVRPPEIATPDHQLLLPLVRR